MPFVTTNQIQLPDILAMASGALEDTLTDLDFLETLASKHCFLVPPFVMRATPTGQMTKMTRLIYTVDGKLDKPRILLEIARQLKRIEQMNQMGRRFTL